ncbi:binuclear zinc transcription factor [Dactylonectria macrodidyma]|uniref:Binuclear zinc transcription factor n=1 Tax=Dactylonectria macrodidyma TaxID=307937 RepID=A0A9P9DNV9_9HYPO|nr:binuclear zinc transcription factor [Dactylonectria macrodidyma]
MAEDSDPSADGGLPMPYSCYECRNRKLKCDRRKDGCSRCAQAGGKCHYPTSRKQPVITVTRPKVKELESRLKDLEYRLKTSQDTSAPAPSHPPPPSEDELIETGRFEQLPPQAVVEELTNAYFVNLHLDAPMLHPARYLASLYLPPHMQPPMCLQYAVMAMGATVCPAHNHLAHAFYRRARYYFEADEMRDGGEHFVTLAHTQCCLLMSHFDIKNLWWSRSSINTSRCVRLAQILGLHQLDGEGRLGPTLPPPKDWCELEERRRTMWAVFCNDRDTSSTTGWPSLISAGRIQTLLPASEEAFQVCIEEPSTTLNKALSHDNFILSVYGCRILAAHLFHECLDHTYQERPDPDPADVHKSVFWKRHEDLNNGLAAAFVTLPDRLRNPSHNNNTQAVTINLQLHTAIICLHRIGVAKIKKYNIPRQVLAGTQVRLLLAAQEIFTIVASLADVNATFHNPMVAFAAYMAGFVFLEDFVDSKNQQSEEKMTALMDLMVAIGHQNSVTASLAVQMAHAIQRTGIDSSALDKVRGLMSMMVLKGPLMAQPDEENGSVVFCPFEIPSKVEGAPIAYPTRT